MSRKNESKKKSDKTISSKTTKEKRALKAQKKADKAKDSE
jgi:hypothetical protein